MLALASLYGCRSAQFDLSARDGNIGFALAPELRERILRPSHIRRILSVDKVESVSATYHDKVTNEPKGYVLLHVVLSLEGDFGFEGISYQEICYARKPTDRDWSSAIEFSLPPSVHFDWLHEIPPDELESLIYPNQRPVPSTGITSPSSPRS